MSRGILGLLASWQLLPSLFHAGGPAAAYACAHLGLFLADYPERHCFCSLSIAETEKHRQDALWLRVGRSNGRLPLREGYAWPNHSVTQHQAPQRPRALGGR